MLMESSKYAVQEETYNHNASKVFTLPQGRE